MQNISAKNVKNTKKRITSCLIQEGYCTVKVSTKRHLISGALRVRVNPKT